jgi:hypothetical protein
MMKEHIKIVLQAIALIVSIVALVMASFAESVSIEAKVIAQANREEIASNQVAISDANDKINTIVLALRRTDVISQKSVAGDIGVSD